MRSVAQIQVILIAAASLVLVGQMASGQQAPTASAESLFGRSARPGETMAQYLDTRRGEFRVFDVDGDGVITEADLKLQRQILEAGARAMALHTLLQLDLDGDGVITRTEVETFFTGTLLRAKSLNSAEVSATDRQQLNVGIDQAMAPDTNGDGRIDSAEMLVYAEKHAIRGNGNPLQWVTLTLDENNDGRVTLEEYLKAAEAAFHKVDSDGNGILSKEEIDAFRKQQMQVPATSK